MPLIVLYTALKAVQYCMYTVHTEWRAKDCFTSYYIYIGRPQCSKKWEVLYCTYIAYFTISVLYCSMSWISAQFHKCLNNASPAADSILNRSKFFTIQWIRTDWECARRPLVYSTKTSAVRVAGNWPQKRADGLQIGCTVCPACPTQRHCASVIVESDYCQITTYSLYSRQSADALRNVERLWPSIYTVECVVCAPSAVPYVLYVLEMSTGPGRMRAGPGRAGLGPNLKNPGWPGPAGRAGPNIAGPGRAERFLNLIEIRAGNL